MAAGETCGDGDVIGGVAEELHEEKIIELAVIHTNITGERNNFRF
jgi:hypothetical protein